MPVLIVDDPKLLDAHDAYSIGEAVDQWEEVVSWAWVKFTIVGSLIYVDLSQFIIIAVSAPHVDIIFGVDAVEANEHKVGS